MIRGTGGLNPPNPPVNSNPGNMVTNGARGGEMAKLDYLYRTEIDHGNSIC